MRKIEVKTGLQTLVEYHHNEASVNNRLVTLARLYPKATISVSPVVKHVELKEETKAELTVAQYSEVK